jgi:hypothetical protein
MNLFLQVSLLAFLVLAPTAGVARRNFRKENRKRDTTPVELEGHTELSKDEDVSVQETETGEAAISTGSSTENFGPYTCNTDSDCSGPGIENPMVCNTEIGQCVDCQGNVGGTVVEDACGVCGGDGSSCSDCNGVPFGSAEIDDCGDCAGGNTGKTANEHKDDCGVCRGDNKDKDDCGVCFGNNRDKDCKDVCFGDALVDHCGICDGTNECCQTSEDGVQLCNDHGACDGTIHACACDFGWTGPLCSLPVSYCHDASGEVALVDCGEHGVCNEAGKGSCICDEGYYGPGCQYKSCSGNGVYSPSIKSCMCAAGFGGQDCERCAVPGETRALQEMFYKLLQEELSAVAVTFGISPSGSGNSNSANVLTGNPPGVGKDDSMVYMCIPPRVYTQKFFDSITVMSSPNSQSTSGGANGVERLLVDYMLVPVPKELVGPYLSGRRAILQGMDTKPVLPNSTHDGVFFDCGCKAWPQEMVRAIEEGNSQNSGKWMGSPAPNALHGRSRLTRSSGISGISGQGRGVSERAQINSSECVDLLDTCLDVLSSMVSAETGTADEIGTAIDEGMDRQFFIGQFMIGLVASVAGFTVLAMASMVAGVYIITLAIRAVREKV